MTRQSRGEWSLVAAACVIAAATACGSSKSKSNDDGSDAGMTCFGNAPTAGMNTSDCSSSSSNTSSNASKPASSNNNTPSKPASNTPVDSGTAVENDNDGGGEPKRSGGASFDGGSTKTSSDTSSDDTWVDAAVMLVQMAGRANCDPLKHDSKLDTAAGQLANNRDSMPDVGAKYHWYAADADKLDTALDILRPLIVDNAPACSWRRYGVGIVGDPGGNRRIVVLLAE